MWRSGWPGRLAVVFMATGLLALVVLLFFGALSDQVRVDRYQIVDVISDASMRRHAVVYRHELAGSSRNLTGIWVIDGTAPDKGSLEKPAGRPIALWSEGIPLIGWQGPTLRLVGDARHKVIHDTNPAETCDLERLGSAQRGEAPTLCLDPARVTFVPMPR